MGALVHIDIIKATDKDMAAVENLVSAYIYDLSVVMGWDCPESGRFGGCDELPQYWGKPAESQYTWPKGWKGYPFIIRVDDKIAGFCLVRQTGEGSYDIGQFLILRRYGRQGVGRHVAHRVFDMFPGEWEVAQMKGNAPAIGFWRRVIFEYTRGGYTEHRVSDPVFKIPMIAQRFRNRR